MEPLSLEQVALRRVSARRGMSFLAGTCLVAVLFVAGCVTTGTFVPHDENKPPTGTPCQVVCTWNKEVLRVPDITRNGAPTPGLMGRVYLFGGDGGFPLIGDGTMTVMLFNDAPALNGGEPVLLEEWRYDKDTLRRLARRDTFGWGYTMFLPWGTCRPDITHVHLRVRYEPPKAVPLFTDSSTLVLERPGVLGPHAASRPAKPRG